MRRLISLLLPAVLAGLLSVPHADAAPGDVAGASDYPGIARFSGSVITGYEAKDFDRTRLQTAPFALGDATADHRPEGRVTRIAYRTPPGPTMDEVLAAFAAQLTQAGYETVFACASETCGGIAFSQGVDVFFFPRMWVDGVAYHYLVGHKQVAGGETWATVLVSHHGRTVTTQLVVTEVGAR